MQEDLRRCFADHFSAEVGVDRSQLEEVFRLRHKVYCVERDFEDPARYIDGLEHDRYDAHSVQMLVRHRLSGLVVGAVRLILPDWSTRSWSFPFEDVCGSALLGRVEETGRRRIDVAEVSRFAVSKTALTAIQRPRVDQWDGAVGSCDDPRRPPQLVALGLIALLFGVSAAHGVNLWYAMMEMALARHLSRLGIDFRQIGAPVEHRGKRYPMMARTADLLGGIAARNPDFRRLVDDVRDAVLAGGTAVGIPGPLRHSLRAGADATRPEPGSLARPTWPESEGVRARA
jgi:N-acyl amino acid synthase of PEP-CTERM/exosortase system